MKKNRRWLPLFASILMLSLPFFLSACGKEKVPVEENSCFSEFDKLVKEAVLENTHIASIVEDGSIEPVIDKIYFGTFSDEAFHPKSGSAKEIFVDCRLKGMPHVGGFDTTAGILMNAETLELISYKEFSGDEVMLHCLQTEKGQSRILCLHTAVGQGHRTPYFDLWTVQGGEWVELPTGIEELIPEEKRGDWGTEDCFLYMGGGDRLAVTYEEDEQIMFEKITYEGGSRIPSELTAILVWNPRQERFELATDTEQPAVGRD